MKHQNLHLLARTIITMALIVLLAEGRECQDHTTPIPSRAVKKPPTTQYAALYP